MTKKPLDAIELLDAEHRAVKDLFDEFRKLSGHQASGSTRKALAEQICMELTIHTRLEEEVFYPPVRDAIGNDGLPGEAGVKHAGAKELIAQILSMKADDGLCDAKVTVLGEYIDHHVREQREEMFPKVRESGIDLALLGDQLRVRKQELQAVPEALREDALVSVSA